MQRPSFSSTRRRLLAGALGTGAMLGGVGAWTTWGGRLAGDSSGGQAGHKALVVLLLSGGNDAFNTFIPLGLDRQRGYAAYQSSRAEFAVNAKDLGEPQAGGRAYAGGGGDAESYLRGLYVFEDEEFGVNGMMPEFARLLADGKASVVANIGTLVEPVTKSTLKHSRVPPFLYAHNHQQRALHTGWADNLSASGWAARIAESWGRDAATANLLSSPLGLNVAFGHEARLMVSGQTRPLVLDPGSTQLFDPAYPGFNLDIFRKLNHPADAFEMKQRLVRQANVSAANVAEILNAYSEQMEDYVAFSDPFGRRAFARPDPEQLGLVGPLSGKLLEAMKSVVQLVALGRNELAAPRQVVFVEMGGFDTHSAQAERHPLLLRELSLGLWQFQQAMERLGMDKEVTLLSLSDFGRSLGNNGNGTDHGWAGHNFMVGGGLSGRRLIGAMPDLRLGGDDDASSKGRMIPTLAIEQYLGAACDWLGVRESQMLEIFPNLAHFTPSHQAPVSKAYVPGLFAL